MGKAAVAPHSSWDARKCVRWPDMAALLKQAGHPQRNTLAEKKPRRIPSNPWLDESGVQAKIPARFLRGAHLDQGHRDDLAVANPSVVRHRFGYFLSVMAFRPSIENFLLYRGDIKYLSETGDAVLIKSSIACSNPASA